MERKGLVRHKILTALTIVIVGCSGYPDIQNGQSIVSVILNAGEYACRSTDPDEDRISDISLMVFDEYGRAEECIWTGVNQKKMVAVSLTKGKKYRFVACANFGYRTKADTADDLTDIRYHMAYPDEYRNGIPMYADSGYIMIENDCDVTLKLIRLMSRISIRIDRSRLSEDVEMNVAGIRIGNCPRSVKVFSESSVESQDDCFPLGFTKTGEECSILNRIESPDISYPLSLYMLENIQGEFSRTPLEDDSEKVFNTYDPRRETCSYIEIDIDYTSDDKQSTDGFLKYRFYLGEDRNNLDIERNCHYRITVCPEDDGLKDDGWRVDKDALTTTVQPTFSYFPESYIRGDIGDTIHLGCRFTPKDATFDVGLEYMENDHKEGIYDYVIDDDGHGAVLTLTGPGRGLIYMSAGPPVNESALWLIEVNLPHGPS